MQLGPCKYERQQLGGRAGTYGSDTGQRAAAAGLHKPTAPLLPPCFLLLCNDMRRNSHYFPAAGVFPNQFSKKAAGKTPRTKRCGSTGGPVATKGCKPLLVAAPRPAASSALTFWLCTDNLRPQVRRHPCDLILDDKLVYVVVAKRKLELWKH